jgi:hypothetical protein
MDLTGNGSFSFGYVRRASSDVYDRAVCCSELSAN